MRNNKRESREWDGSCFKNVEELKSTFKKMCRRKNTCVHTLTHMHSYTHRKYGIKQDHQDEQLKEVGDVPERCTEWNAQKQSSQLSRSLMYALMHWILIVSFTRQLNDTICHRDSSLANQHSALRECVFRCMRVFVHYTADACSTIGS